MSPVTTRPALVPERLRPGRVLAALVGVAVVAALAVAVAPLFREEPPVPRLIIDNSTVYQVNVEVSDGKGSGWFDLGAVGRERSKTLEEVADQGSRWVFRFSYGGVDAGQLAVSRRDLASMGWRVAIPDTAAQRLHAAGLAPSAR